MSSKAIVFLSGTLYWAKVLGKPRPNYGGDGMEWTFEFEPDEAGQKVLKEHGLTDRLKNKYEDRGKFLTLRKAELNRNGEANPPIRVYDADDTEWDQTKLIGNGSKGDVKLDIRDYGVGKKKGVYPVAIRVTDLVQYQSSEFGGMDTAGTSPKVKADVKTDIDLDDDVPF